MSSFMKMMKKKLEIANILVFYMGIWIAVISFLKDNKKFCMSLTQIRFKEDFICGTFLKLFLLLWCFNKQECQSVELQFQKLTEKSSKVGSFKDMNQLLERVGLISKGLREWLWWKNFFMLSFAQELWKKEIFQLTWNLSSNTLLIL